MKNVLIFMKNRLGLGREKAEKSVGRLVQFSRQDMAGTWARMSGKNNLQSQAHKHMDWCNFLYFLIAE